MTRARDLASATPGSTGIPFRIASGKVTPGAGSSGYATITYPAGRFTQAPQLVGTGDGAGATSFNVMTGNHATSSATIQSTGNITGYAIHWIAIQMTSGSASG